MTTVVMGPRSRAQLHWQGRIGERAGAAPQPVADMANKV